MIAKDITQQEDYFYNDPPPAPYEWQSYGAEILADDSSRFAIRNIENVQPMIVQAVCQEA